MRDAQAGQEAVPWHLALGDLQADGAQKLHDPKGERRLLRRLHTLPLCHAHAASRSATRVRSSAGCTSDDATACPTFRPTRL